MIGKVKVRLHEKVILDIIELVTYGIRPYNEFLIARQMRRRRLSAPVNMVLTSLDLLEEYKLIKHRNGGYVSTLLGRSYLSRN